MDELAHQIGWLSGLEAVLALGAFLLSAAGIVVLRPVLVRYAMARPNARSSHVAPTPQGGGIAVIGAVVCILVVVLGANVASALRTEMIVVLGAAVALAAVGAADDVRTLGVAPRLLLQAACVAAVLLVLPPDLRIAPFVPLVLERAALLVAGVWFVNLTNFMDGIDWLTVAQVVSVTIGVMITTAAGELPVAPALLAATLLGAILGFAPANRPVARLFLGDVGSLPIGLLLGWMLLRLALAGHVAAALLLALYPITDATVTLLRRLWRGERVWQAHRSHFYQQATDNGFSVLQIVARVFTLNLVLIVLALVTVLESSAIADLGALALGSALVAWLMLRFSTGRSDGA